MWRYLTGLNKTDLAQEFRSINLQTEKFLQLNEIQNGSFIKATGLSDAQFNLIGKRLNGFNEVLMHSLDGNQKWNSIFSLSSGKIVEFQKQISAVDGLSELNLLLQNIAKESWVYRLGDKKLEIDHPLIMGILNVTPDSFSDGGKYFNEDKAYQHALEMLESGADIIDVGGESTRPGSEPISLQEEWSRVSGVLKKLLMNEECIISVDTYKSEIARRALETGVHIINDISGLTFDPEMAGVVAESQVPMILMHIKGTPRNMQKNPTYKNVMDEVYHFLDTQCQVARKNGIDQLIVDPGIGFGKRPEDNYELIRRLGEFKALGYPILLGVSRKSFIGFGLKDPQKDRMVGSITSLIYGVLNGANIVRVHDVEETKQALQIADAIKNFKAIS